MALIRRNTYLALLVVIQVILVPVSFLAHWRIGSAHYIEKHNMSTVSTIYSLYSGLWEICEEDPLVIDELFYRPLNISYVLIPSNWSSEGQSHIHFKEVTSLRGKIRPRYGFHCIYMFRGTTESFVLYSLLARVSLICGHVTSLVIGGLLLNTAFVDSWENSKTSRLISGVYAVQTLLFMLSAIATMLFHREVRRLPRGMIESSEEQLKVRFEPRLPASIPVVTTILSLAAAIASYSLYVRDRKDPSLRNKIKYDKTSHDGENKAANQPQDRPLVSFDSLRRKGLTPSPYRPVQKGPLAREDSWLPGDPLLPAAAAEDGPVPPGESTRCEQETSGVNKRTIQNDPEYSAFIFA